MRARYRAPTSPMASASASTWAGARYTSSGSEMLGSETSAMGLYGIRRARTAVFITLPMRRSSGPSRMRIGMRDTPR